MKGHRKTSKFDICTTIVEAKDSGAWKRWADAQFSADSVKPEKPKANVVINCHRLCNALFSDVIRPKLVTLGNNLTQLELDIGLKKDQRLHEAMAAEYNCVNVEEYDKNAFPNLKRGDPRHPHTSSQLTR